jgi:HEAT repeat protein
MCSAPHAKERNQALHALKWMRGEEDVGYDDPVCSVVFKNLEHEDAEVRSHACDLVPFLSLQPARLVSTLVPLIDDASCEVASAASKALLELAEKGTDVAAAVPALCRLLARRECDRCDVVYLPFEQCCKILLLLPREIAKPAVPLLEASLCSESGQVVRSAAEALAKIDEQVDNAFPRLKALLENGELHPESFCDALYTIGPAAAPFTDELVRLLAEPDWDTQWAAADALGSIASTHPASISALITALSHPSGIVRSAAVRALGQLGEAAVPYLIRVLREGDDEEKEWAADALGVIGTDASAAVDDLRREVKNSNQDVRDWSAIALAKITESAEFVPHLLTIARLREGPNLHARCAEALGAIGSDAAEPVAVLKSMLLDQNEAVRTAAEEAISRIDNEAG